MVFGTLYPAYRSYKAVKNKDVREYVSLVLEIVYKYSKLYFFLRYFFFKVSLFQVKWMMYWIIFAFFTTGETFADVFLSW